jgi:hypothetical protein
MENQMKKCFVVMPISDQEGYEKGHFNRVYEHLIKPACEKVGFIAIRADEEVKTNYIVVDIIKKILDSEMVICDLSAKNPNVLYELGLRQAFNKKVVLIKDKKTSRIFDIQGLRTLDYDNTLRIDEVNKSIDQISKTILETYESKGGEINSLIQLLAIQPADLPSQINLSQESSLILDTLSEISNRLRRLEKPEKSEPENFDSIISLNGFEFKVGDSIYNGSDLLGQLVDIHSDALFIKKEEKVNKMDLTDERLSNAFPF